MADFGDSEVNINLKALKKVDYTPDTRVPSIGTVHMKYLDCNEVPYRASNDLSAMICIRQSRDMHTGIAPDSDPYNTIL